MSSSHTTPETDSAGEDYPPQPLTKREAQLIADVYKMLPLELPGFVGRPQQKDMISFAARMLANEMVGIVEAPTGTGKSFAYQIPGIVLAVSRDRRVILSTETASLQDQIFGRDLQLLDRIFKKLGMEVPIAIAKGRERYVCPLRLDALSSQASLIDEDNSQGAINQIADAWGAGWNGQRDSLSFRVAQPVWQKINNNRHMCTNDRCPKAAECPHMIVKTQLKDARVIVVNHSYLLATIAAHRSGESTGKKNPVVDFDKNYYVFDEAHHLHDRCIESFASKAVISEEMMYAAEATLASLGSGKAHLFGIRAEAMRGIGNALRSNIRSIVGTGDHHRFLLGKVPETMLNLVREYANCVQVISEVMADAIDDAIKAAGGNDHMRATQQVIVGNASSLHGQLTELQDSLDQFCVEGANPRAKWIDFKKDECAIHAAPFEAGGLAREMLWKQMRGAVLTSATIASLGEFGPVLLGLGLPKDTPTLRLSSPLDYSRARIVVPRKLVDANSPGHTLMVTALIRSAAFNGEHRGGLAYFTSRRKMEGVYENLTDAEKESVIIQGQLAPTAMIAEHKRRIDAGRRSILFGLDSLSEGVDLPREYCSLVFMDKLPFPSPADPILASHAEHLEAKGLHPFAMLMLPRAGLKLAQLVGRLVRTEDDWGEVWILDRRLVEKSYGNRLLKSTPFASVTQI